MFGLRKYAVVYVIAAALVVCMMTADAWEESRGNVSLFAITAVTIVGAHKPTVCPRLQTSKFQYLAQALVQILNECHALKVCILCNRAHRFILYELINNFFLYPDFWILGAFFHSQIL